MDKLGMMREALRELGDAPAERLAAYMKGRFGVEIEPRFVPLFKATLRAKQQLEEPRVRTKALLATPAADEPVTGQSRPGVAR